MIEAGGVFVANQEDETVKQLGEKYEYQLQVKEYATPIYKTTSSGTLLEWEGKQYPLSIFGAHNLQNLIGAMRLAESMNISNDAFLSAMANFTGAGKRLQKVVEGTNFTMFKDFAHSPSKLKATTKAVKEQYADRKVVACMELHTFSSLKKEFLPQYENAMAAADLALVYFSPKVVAHKKLEPITVEQVKQAFGGNVHVVNETSEVLDFIHAQDWNNAVLLMMSSGNFDGIDYDQLGAELKK